MELLRSGGRCVTLLFVFAVRVGRGGEGRQLCFAWLCVDWATAGCSTAVGELRDAQAGVATRSATWTACMAEQTIDVQEDSGCVAPRVTGACSSRQLRGHSTVGPTSGHADAYRTDAYCGVRNAHARAVWSRRCGSESAVQPPPQAWPKRRNRNVHVQNEEH